MASDVARVQGLIEPVGEAQKAALRLVDELGKKGDRQTGQATMILQRLTAIEIALFDLKDRSNLAEIVATLRGLAEECDGALGALRPSIEGAIAGVGVCRRVGRSTRNYRSSSDPM